VVGFVPGGRDKKQSSSGFHLSKKGTILRLFKLRIPGPFPGKRIE